jgi:hypothetical protein
MLPETEGPSRAGNPHGAENPEGAENLLAAAASPAESPLPAGPRAGTRPAAENRLRPRDLNAVRADA